MLKTTKRDHLLEIQQKILDLWDKEKIFERNADDLQTPKY